MTGCDNDTFVLIHNHHTVYTVSMHYICVKNLLFHDSERKRRKMAAKFCTSRPLIMYGRKRRKKFVSILSLPFLVLLAYIRHWKCALSYRFPLDSDLSLDVLISKLLSIFYFRSKWNNIFTFFQIRHSKILSLVK